MSPVLPILLGDIKATWLPFCSNEVRRLVSFSLSQKYAGPLYPYVRNGFFIVRILFIRFGGKDNKNFDYTILRNAILYNRMKRLLHHHLENPLPVPLVVGCRFGCSERFACSRRGGMFAGEGIGWFAAKQKNISLLS